MVRINKESTSDAANLKMEIKISHVHPATPIYMQSSNFKNHKVFALISYMTLIWVASNILEASSGGWAARRTFN